MSMMAVRAAVGRLAAGVVVMVVIVLVAKTAVIAMMKERMERGWETLRVVSATGDRRLLLTMDR